MNEIQNYSHGACPFRYEEVVGPYYGPAVERSQEQKQGFHFVYPFPVNLFKSFDCEGFFAGFLDHFHHHTLSPLAQLGGLFKKFIIGSPSRYSIAL